MGKVLYNVDCMTLSKKWKLKTSLRGSIATAAITSLLLLTACGGDSSTSPVPSKDNEQFGSSSSSVTLGDNEGASSNIDSLNLSSSDSEESGSSKVPEPAEGSSSSSSVELTYGTMTDSRDGQTYKTVKIGDQTWMAENLNYEAAASYCYKDDATNCTKYGRLYTWAAAMDSSETWTTNGKGCGYNKTCSPTYPVRGVCPSGWHLPSRAEWETLFNAVGELAAGKVLKSTSGWISSSNGTDAFGFSALPAGFRDIDGNYNFKGSHAHFWSSTEYHSGYAYYMYLLYSRGSAYLDLNIKNDGISVRCLKD